MSKEGKARNWQVVVEPPIMNKKRDGIKIECWFIESHQFVSVEILKFAAISKSPFEKVTFAAFLQENIKHIDFINNNLDAELTRYAQIAGFDPIRYTRSMV
jgi:hypothetical protein